MDALVSYSTDDGQTWSVPDVVTANGLYGMSHLEISVHNGKAILSFATPSSGHNVIVTYGVTSVGHLATPSWTTPTLEYGSTASCFLPGGEVAAIAYFLASTPFELQNSIEACWSRDDITTWTAQQDLFNYDGTNFTGPWRIDLYPQIACDGNGRVAAAWQAHLLPDGRFPPTKSDIYLAFGEDDTTTWTQLAMANADAFTNTTDNTHPDIACAANGGYVVVWQSAGAGSISEIRYAAGKMPLIAHAKDWQLFR